VRRHWLKTLRRPQCPAKGRSDLHRHPLATDAEFVAGIGGNHLAAQLLGWPDTGHGRNTAQQTVPGEAAEPARW
jgi:ParB family chromosome partitioning protein